MFVAGCQTPYAPVPFDNATAGVTSITIVEDAMLEPNIRKLASNGGNMTNAAAASGGLIGALVVGAVAGAIEANIAGKQREKLRQALDSQGFDAEKVFDEALSKALAENGFSVGEEAFERSNTGKLLVLPAKQDAAPEETFLDIATTGIGYQLVGGNTN